MAGRPIVVVPHDSLCKRADEITDIDQCIRKLAHDMADTLYKAPGLGLAANQVGETVRLIVVDVVYPYAEPKDKKRAPIFVINPEICACEGDEVRTEGCLSVPELEVDIRRPACVRIKGVDLDGKPLTLDAEGLLARVLQHEVDHLEGTTILDHASVLKRSLYHRRARKSHRRGR